MRLTESELALINQYTRSPLAEEEIYTFTVRLCDNQIDRDYERFTKAALEKLAALYVGKSGIFDHSWTAKGQFARIYKTEVVADPAGKAYGGEEAHFLKGWAYMVRSEETESLIGEIEAGIKKEVSVGCAIGSTSCSICGGEQYRCSHRAGQTYDGKLCWFDLDNPTDAYEWSFVAVPAQKDAGVIKSKRYGGETPPPDTGIPADWGSAAALALEEEKYKFIEEDKPNE